MNDLFNLNKSERAIELLRMMEHARGSYGLVASGTEAGIRRRATAILVKKGTSE
jgi:hypothetical protein